VQKNVIQKALAEALEPMRAEAERLAPVDPAKGDLKRAIRVGAKRATGYSKANQYSKSLESSVVAYMGVATKSGAYPEAVIQEFGSAPHVIRPRRKGGKTALQVKMPDGSYRKPKDIRHPGHKPHPFMRPAYDLHADGVVKRMGEVIGDQITKAADRAARRQAKKLAKSQA
jgi:HK97 gp10 family phage protein